jgi:hypothetical protein
VERVANWDVHSFDLGVGEILEERGLEHISAESGTILHKAGLASFIFQNLADDHLRKVAPDGFEAVNSECISELTSRLTDLFDFIFATNRLI